MKEIQFTCPVCGKTWLEQQTENDDWFALATDKTLCNDCTEQVLTELT